MRILLAISLFPVLAAAQGLGEKIAAIAAGAEGQVAVSCAVEGVRLDCHRLAGSRPPMQSVFKLPLAMAALDRAEKGELGLDQMIRFLPDDRILPRTYSPLQDKYPEGNVDVPLRELLQAAVMMSDNTASDIVLRVLGGPARVTGYVQRLGVRGFHLEDNEAGLHRELAAQYRNWFEPRGAVALLRLLHEQSPLNREHTALLLGWMRESPTGARRINGMLPEGTVVMHKTGTSGTRDGVTQATNDIGLVPLPNGKMLALAVFVTDARAEAAKIESVIAAIARAIYDEAARR